MQRSSRLIGGLDGLEVDFRASSCYCDGNIASTTMWSTCTNGTCVPGTRVPWYQECIRVHVLCTKMVKWYLVAMA